MVTEPNEFIQKLQELQDSTEVTYTTLPSDEPRFIIDANTRSITIPPEFQFLGVKNDHKAETVYFEIDRYFDAMDLSTQTCVIQFSNNENSGFYPVTSMDTATVDGKIIFGWEILNDVTAAIGNISFSVRFYTIDESNQFTYNFNTLTVNSVILDTLDVDNPGVVENYPSELEAWLDRMNELEAGTSGKVEEIEAKGQEVLTEINSVKNSIPEDYSTLSSDVDGLKSDLVDYIDKEKIISKGNELGWYALEGGQVVEKTHSSWSRLHLTKPFAFNSMRFTIGTQIKCVFIVANGTITSYEQVGTYDVNISEASDVYMNFFGSSFVDKYYFYYGYNPYESGYIKFKIRANQKIVNTYDVANELLDNEIHIANVTCHLKLPTTYRPYGKKTKLLMVCHGAGRGVTIPNPTDNGTWEDNTNYNALIDTFVNAGYAIFDCNGMQDDYWGCNFWGAHKGVEVWKKAYDYIVKNYNVEENFSIYGFSMGGLTAMHLVINKFPNIKCVALGSPVLDLEKCWEDGQTTLMKNAYGMGDNYEAEKARGCDPMKTLVTIGEKEYCLVDMPPIKIWYGSTEQGVAVNKEYAKRMVNAISNSGNWAIYREVQGENHRICFGAVQYINNEYLYWINRFNNTEYDYSEK